MIGEQKVAVIIGGSRGIGAAVARHLASSMAVVIGYSGDAAGAAATTAAVEKDGGIASAIRADVRNPTDVDALFAEVAKRYGRIDVLVNSAGISGTAMLSGLDWTTMGEVFDVNVKAAIYCSARALPLFPDSGGAIVNLGSALAQQPMPGQVVYAATKAGIEAATRVLAQELGGRGIRVNAIAPGPVDTALLGADDDVRGFLASKTALGRIAQPEDIARVVAFLASSDAAWITGQVVTADGGLRI